MNKGGMADFDLAIIGGGINGVGIARDAAGRGLRVLLVEQNDLASGASSASTKLIHGGLRYLERGELRLVRDALGEREVLMRIAPHVVRPLRFVLPPQDETRPAWLVRAALFLYDHLASRKILPSTKTLDLTHHICGAPLRRRFTFAFEYSDCSVDDSRLVVLNAADAAARGAHIRTRTRCIRADRGEKWTSDLNARGRRDVATARVLVNAAGAWVGSVAETVLRTDRRAPVRLAKGSHIVVKGLFDHGRGYVLPTADRRIVFALPFERDFTLIGTTDEDFVGDLASPVPSVREIQYLCDAANSYFRQNITPSEIIWAYAGVRALFDDGATRVDDVARDYVLTVDEADCRAPLLNVYGGKITTYRRLAEAALDKLGHYFATKPRWTARTPLLGGEFGRDGIAIFVAEMRTKWPFLSEDLARRLACAYGTRVDLILGNASSMSDLGACIGADLTVAEIRYLMRYEWAETAEDVLWRRSKLGLHMNKDEQEAVARFMSDEIGAGCP